MTPLEIGILLHYYSSGADYRGGDFSAPAVREAIDLFRGGLGLLMDDISEHPRAYRLTERGECFVEHLKRQPLPVQVWVMPVTEREAG